MSRKDHCKACEAVRELETHRDRTAPEWGVRRATLNFALVVVRGVCAETREHEEKST